MHNPLEQFQINVFLPIHIGRWDISLTNAGLTMILTTLFIIGMSFFMTRKLTIVPSVAQTAFETLYDFIEKMVVVKQVNDVHTPILTQMMAAEYMKCPL